jgi:predicted GIY-YIG superfamily endonuclease
MKDSEFIRKIYPTEKITYVYGLIDPRDSSLFWVGMTNSPRHRYEQHHFNIGEKNPAKQKLVEEIVKSGNQPGMVLIEEFKTRTEAASLEERLIVFLSGVTKINLTNIEHKSDKTWSFKAALKAERSGQPWSAGERAILIGMYKKGAICELIAKDLGRTKMGVEVELYKTEKAGFLSIRSADLTIINATLEKAKFPVKYLTEEDKDIIAGFLPKVSSRYGDLNADHLKYDFKNKSLDGKRK